ncbi:hypothetical protein HK100_002021 [Physocladia obscura]|uniref:Transglutaminase domain-containing protein n=1 Tax=Physocladia obscura TaxID=109957 RepID=A0AAD5SVY7_9FUNG|nr:hypothetical protein HK100_002021 [Physocladia obscura]
MNHNFWATQSAVTNVGEESTAAIDALPNDLTSLRHASSQLVFHYRAGGDYSKHGVPTARKPEINTRYAKAMLDLILGRGDGGSEPTLSRDRAPCDRLVGCCRDATILFLALARRKNIAARARVGYATYFERGYFVDHVVAEVFDAAAARWRLVDAEMDDAFKPSAEDGRVVDWMDLKPGVDFLTGAQAWRAARDGRVDPTRFVVASTLDVPDLRGWPHIAHNLIHDLAALNKTEMILWDAWGMQLHRWDGVVPEQDALLLDKVSAITVDTDDIDPAAIRELAAQDGLSIPPVVKSFDPYGGAPVDVDVRRIIEF